MIARKFSQLAGILLLASTTFTFVSIFSYSPKDPTWNYYISDVEHWHNWGGAWGASLADWGLQLLGSALLLLIAMGLLGGWSLVSLRPRWTLQIFLRGILLLLAGSTLLALLFVDDPLFRVIAFPGGFVGYYVTDILSPMSSEGMYGITGGILAFALLVGLPYRRWVRQAQYRLTTVRGALHQRTQEMGSAQGEDVSPEQAVDSRSWAGPQLPLADTRFAEETLLESTGFAANSPEIALNDPQEHEQTLPQVSAPPAWNTSFSASVDALKPEPASLAPEEQSRNAFSLQLKDANEQQPFQE